MKGIRENENMSLKMNKILRNFDMQTDLQIPTRRLDFAFQAENSENKRFGVV